MRAFLLYRDRDFDPHLSLREGMGRRDREVDWRQRLSPPERALVQDLELRTLLSAMAGEDEFLLAVARKAFLSGFQNNVDTILYRQQALKDCLKNPDATLALYDLTVQTIGGSRRHFWGLSSHYPSSLLYEALELMSSLLDMLKRLREFAKEQTGRFDSEAFTTLFAMLAKELDDNYLATIQNYLTDLKFRRGVLLSAELGEWNECTNYILRLVGGKDLNWFQRLLGKRRRGYSFQLHERDEAGARILGDMRHRAISRVSIALAQSADHVLSFFQMMRTELAFYVGCLNLYRRLTAKQEPVCFPAPAPEGARIQTFSGLYDVCLTLLMDGRVVGNSTAADGKNFVIITGANQGGKSSFLRSIGLAQMMMQSGMFVAAEAFRAEICPRLFTHYKREEDAKMESGKLDEELARMSDIADHVGPNSLVLFNESFAATNDREGSEIARQVVTALLEKHVKIFYVTHLYEFASGFFNNQTDGTLFLRAERLADGTRTFRLLEAEPLDTSYGEDLYRQMFELDRQPQNGGSNGVASALVR